MGTMLLPLYLLFLLVLTSNRIFSVKFCLLACTKFLTAYKLTISKIALDITSSILKSKVVCPFSYEHSSLYSEKCMKKLRA